MLKKFLALHHHKHGVDVFGLKADHEPDGDEVLEAHPEMDFEPQYAEYLEVVEAPVDYVVVPPAIPAGRQSTLDRGITFTYTYTYFAPDSTPHDLDIVFDYDPGEEGHLSGLPENCSPPIQESVELLSVMTQEGEELLEVLSTFGAGHTLQELEDACLEEAHRLQQPDPME